MRHHPKCTARDRLGLCCDRPVACVKIQEAIDAFNADDSKTRRSHPDSREHRYARWPILAQDCDYEVSGFSGIEGRSLMHEQAMKAEERY